MSVEPSPSTDAREEDVRTLRANLLRSLARDVAKVATPGIGRWDRAWAIVDAPSADFMAALSAWESEPRSERAKESVRVTYRSVIEAWRRSVAEYERERLAVGPESPEGAER